MSSGEWKSSHQNGRVSPARNAGSGTSGSTLPQLVNISPIPVSTDTPRDSGRSSPDSPVTPHNSTLKDDTTPVSYNNNVQNSDLLSTYKEEIKLLRSQIQKLQQAGNIQVENGTNELRKKVASIESDHADKLRAFNEETIKLHSEVAKLRATVERGEVSKQKLEYELALAHKAANQEKRVAAEKEASLLKMNGGFKESIAKLQKQVKDVENSLEASKKKNTKDEKTFRQELSAKAHVIEQLSQQIKYAEEEKDKLHNVIQEQESMYSEMEEKCSALEAQRSSQGETVHKQMKDLEFASDREERLKKEIEQYQERVKSLEESIEAERAAHLETKFNSEIVQLRVRDLEGAVEVEKSALDEARQNMEMITQQKRELESALEKERDSCSSEKGKVINLEENLELERRTFAEDLDEKQKMIAKLSKQLEVHEKNFEALKSELTQAKKRQIHLDTTYGSSMRELELLLHNFQVEKPDTKKKQTGQRKEKNKQPSPAVILENLRHTLLDYQNRCSNASSELKRLREVMEKVSSECERYKEMVMSRDKAVKETQSALAGAKKELAKVNTDGAEKDATIAALNVDVQRLQKNIEEQRTRLQDNEEQNMKLKTAYSQEDESRCTFLHTLYQRMITGQVYINSPDSVLSKYSWADMSSLVAEQVAAQLSEVHRANERSEHLERVLASKEDALRQSQEAHEQTVAKLSSAIKDRENSWKKQKSELEDHYAKLMNDLHNRTQKTQTLADEAWSKVHKTGEAKETLEHENARLQQTLQQSHRHKGCLLTSCALLAGALWPAFVRIRSLSSQRNILSEYVKCLEALREQTHNLGDMLSNEMDEKKKDSRDNYMSKSSFADGRRPILVFRVGVIAVLAANRIHHFAAVSSRVFISTECPGEIGGLSAVLCGGVGKTRRPFKGLARVRRESYSTLRSRDTGGTLNVRSWLTSAQLEDHVVTTVTELQQMLCHTTGSSSSVYSGGRESEEFPDELFRPSSSSPPAAIVAAARSAYSKLISRLQAEFAPSSSEEEAMWRDGYSGYRNDLIFQLGQGLQKYITETTQYTSSQFVVSSLQGHILSFTQRLHTAEVDRRGLKLELSKTKQDCSELKSAHLSGQDETRKARDGVRTMEERLHSLQEEMLSMIPVARFENVCEELNHALKREQQAQALLNEQTTQMQEMGARLDLHSTQGEERDATLGEAVKGLSEAKMELRRQEHAVRQMTKQTTYLENEKRLMTERLNDADKALNANAREKEALLNYLRSVEKSLEQSIEQVRLSQGAMGAYEFSLPNLMLPDERLALEGFTMGPEMLACQNVVGVFVEAQQEALERISRLETEKQQALSRLGLVEKEISSHKAHIASLKEELAAACRRQMSEDGMSDNGRFGALDGYPVRDPTSRKFTDYHSDDSYKNEFVPLSAHRDSSAASFRPSFASTGAIADRTIPDKTTGSFSSPKRRSSSSSYRRQARRTDQDFNRFLNQGS